MKEVIETTVGVLTALTLAGGILAYAARAIVRRFLLPWLREHLLHPVQETRAAAAETNRQVTVNGHTSPDKTLLDKIDEVQRTQIVAARMFEGHMNASEEDRTELWLHIRALEGEQEPTAGKHRDRRTPRHD